MPEVQISFEGCLIRDTAGCSLGTPPPCWLAILSLGFVHGRNQERKERIYAPGQAA